MAVVEVTVIVVAMMVVMMLEVVFSCNGDNCQEFRLTGKLF